MVAIGRAAVGQLICYNGRFYEIAEFLPAGDITLKTIVNGSHGPFQQARYLAPSLNNHGKFASFGFLTYRAASVSYLDKLLADVPEAVKVPLSGRRVFDSIFKYTVVGVLPAGTGGNNKLIPWAKTQDTDVVVLAQDVDPKKISYNYSTEMKWVEDRLRQPAVA